MREDPVISLPEAPHAPLRCGLALALLVALAASGAEAQNLVRNGRFDSDIAGWLNPGGIWNPLDGNGAGGSGSMEVTNLTALANTLRNATQCINVAPGVEYTFRALAFLRTGQSQTGRARLSVLYLPTPGCSGPALAPAALLAETAQLGVWIRLEGSVKPPASAASVLIILSVTKVEATGAFRALFDDVFFGEPCSFSATNLCVHGRRFGIRATWMTAQPTTGSGAPIPITGEAGWFWFFSPSNPEILIKVINGCPLNNRFWVFAGGLTSVRVDLTVLDYETGATKTYTNPQGKAFQPIQDTSAFATCP